MKSKPIKVLHFHLCIIPYVCDFPKALKLQLSACGCTCILVHKSLTLKVVKVEVCLFVCLKVPVLPV